MKTKSSTVTSKEIFSDKFKKMSVEELLAHPAYARIKFSDKVYPTFTIYFHCSDSPSGVMRVGGGLLKNYPSNGPIGTYGPSRGDIAAMQWSI